MSSRVAEKRRRREQRAENDRQRVADARRSRWIRIAAAGAVAALGVGAAVAALLLGGSKPSSAESAAASANPFGQHYAGLVQRREQAGVPTMMDTMSTSVHHHATLSVFVNGKQVAVPANIGIDPAKDPMEMAGLHTHDPTGTIHVEGAPRATLGKFFAIWGVPFSSARLGPYKARGERAVRMWVDGKAARTFGALKLADGQKITVIFGSSERLPA